MADIVPITPDWFAIFDAAADPCLVLDPQFRIIAVNQAYLHATMTRRENVVGHRIFEIYPYNPEDLAATGSTNLRASLETVLKRHVTDAMAVQKYDIRKPATEGGAFEERFWSPINTPVFGSEGELIYILHRVQDVTEFVQLRQKVGGSNSLRERKKGVRAERVDAESYTRAQEVAAHNLELKRLNDDLEVKNKKLQELSDNLTKIFHAAPSILAITTLEEGRIIDINEAGLASSGYQRFEAIGSNIQELYAWDPPTFREEMVRLLKEQGYVRDLELKFRSSSGDIVYLLYSAELIYLDNTPCVLSLGKDITDRKQWENELLGVNQDLEAVNYSVAHGLRQPLKVLFGYCQGIEMLCGGRLDDHCRHFLQQSRHTILRMSKQIDSLLNFARLSKVKLYREAVDLSAMAQEVADTVRKADPKRKDVTFRIGQGILAYGDPKLLRIVLDNLISYVWEFTSNQPQALIEFGTVAIDTGVAYLVRVNGTGFEARGGRDLFAPFDRSTSAEKATGYGIDLATVRRIIMRHGGRVWAKSEVGNGATFYFTLSAGRNDRRNHDCDRGENRRSD